MHELTAWPSPSIADLCMRINVFMRVRPGFLRTLVLFINTRGTCAMRVTQVNKPALLDYLDLLRFHS